MPCHGQSAQADNFQTVLRRGFTVQACLRGNNVTAFSTDHDGAAIRVSADDVGHHALHLPTRRLPIPFDAQFRIHQSPIRHGGRDQHE